MNNLYQPCSFPHILLKLVHGVTIYQQLRNWCELICLYVNEKRIVVIVDCWLINDTHYRGRKYRVFWREGGGRFSYVSLKRTDEKVTTLWLTLVCEVKFLEPLGNFSQTYKRTLNSLINIQEIPVLGHWVNYWLFSQAVVSLNGTYRFQLGLLGYWQVFWNSVFLIITQPRNIFSSFDYYQYYYNYY